MAERVSPVAVTAALPGGVAAAPPRLAPALAAPVAPVSAPTMAAPAPPTKPPKMSLPVELEPFRLLREKPLPKKVLEDNYEISDKEDTDDECEEEQERLRASKVVPAWSADYKQALAAQDGIDPDSIFSSRVPFCDSDAIFPDDLYRQYRQKPPRRKRGSSCQWHKDRLSASEIARYRAKMGQQKRWSSLRKKTITVGKKDKSNIIE